MSDIRNIEFGSPEFAVWLKVRDEVLRKPLGLSWTDEEIDADAHEIHLCLFVEDAECTLYTPGAYRVHSGKSLVAGLILKRQPDTSVFKMRQVAVLPECQSRGFGAELVRFSEDFAREKGGTEMVLHARDTAIPFYEKLNYRAVGEPFEEVGIVHFKMQKQLPPE